MKTAAAEPKTAFVLFSQFFSKMKKDIKPIEKLLDGNDIMELTGIKRGPELGKIVNALKEAQIASEVTTKKEAEEFVRKFSQTIT